MKFLRVVLMLCIAVILFFVFFHKSQFKIAFQVLNAASDTTVKNSIGHKSNTYPGTIAVRAMGEIDSPTEVFIRDLAYSTKCMSGQRQSSIRHGPESITRNKLTFSFYTKKATKRVVKIISSYLTPDKDTLADG